MSRRIRYENYDGVRNEQTLSDMFRWMKERRQNKKNLMNHIPQADKKQEKELQNNRRSFSLTWVGHATFLIQMDGLNILTDPVWSKWMGTQKRLTDPGISLDALPEIDIVVISHGHYDHLDFKTIKRIKGDPEFYVPAGLKSAFTRRAYKHVTEANWWDNFTEGGLKISFVPAQHWSKRTMTDTNTSHWGGWILEDTSTSQSVYFVGDTGYFKGFKDIEEKFDIDIVLMPIGAYEPEWFMKISHINPEDGIKAFMDLKGKKFVPMHYGAYRLADDTGPEALGRLLKEWDRLNLDEDLLKLLNLGETYWGS